MATFYTFLYIFNILCLFSSMSTKLNNSEVFKNLGNFRKAISTIERCFKIILIMFRCFIKYFCT